MKVASQLRVSLVLSAIMLVLLASAIVSLYKVDRLRADTRHEDVLYIPSAKVLKRMSLGYTGLAGDIYWTRTVQYFGWKHSKRDMNYDLLYPLLEITTDLDPHLLVAYEFGAAFLSQKPPNGAGQPDQAVELVERGIKYNPNEWRLYYELGFVQAMERHDYIAAADAFRRGSQVPNAHPFLRILAASMAQHGGELETARMLWQTTLNTTEDPMIKVNAERHLQALQVDEIVPKLEELARAYRERTGIQPTSFRDLIRAGYLRGIPMDPLGRPYRLQPDGRVEVQDPDDLPFIEKGLPPGYKPLMKNVPGMKL
jgi:tetratricopeptide (TPR) repeat protein